MSTWEANNFYQNWFCFSCPSCRRTLIVSGYVLTRTNENVTHNTAVQCSFCEHIFGVGLIVEPYKGPIPEDAEEINPSNIHNAPAVLSTLKRSSAEFNPSRLNRSQVSTQRSNTMNPNNPSHKAATNNRSNQMNSNNPAYRSSRSHGGKRS